MREIGKSVGQRVLARPPDALKRIDKVRPAAQSNKPEASIHRGTKYCILVAEIAKGVRDIARGNFGYVAANYHDGSGGQFLDNRSHAFSKIAAALRKSSISLRPWV